MYKIAHISDPHLSNEDSNEHGKKFIEVLKKAIDENCDHLIITGDISDTPEESDLNFARKILEDFDLLNKDRLTVIPGNHDIFGSPPPGEDGFKFPLICKETDFEYNLKLFYTFFKETFPEPRVGEEDIIFPFLKIVNKNIALISANSVARWSLEKNPESSNGEISIDNLERMNMIFGSIEDSELYKIVLTHHHFNEPELNPDFPYHSMWLKVVNHKMKLHNKNEIIKIFSENDVDMILHGHTHINQTYNIEGLTFINSSAGIMPLTYDKERSFQILNIPDSGYEKGSIEIEKIIIPE